MTALSNIVQIMEVVSLLSFDPAVQFHSPTAIPCALCEAIRSQVLLKAPFRCRFLLTGSLFAVILMAVTAFYGGF
jgi:hypothetical protein